jgi:hypothetical protein
MTKRAPLKEIFLELDDRHRWATVQVNEAERQTLLTDIPAVTYALYDAAHVFDLIAQGFASGHLRKCDAGVTSLARICAAHLNALAEKEGDNVLRLKDRLAEPVRIVLAGEQP